MRELSSDYISGSAASARDVYVKIALNDDENTVYEADKIISLNIQRGITDGSFGIGFTPSDRLSCSIITNSKIPEKTRITVYIRFSSSGTWERLGRFYCKTCIRDGSAVNVTAFDAMDWQKNKQVKFGGKASIELAALSFPCTMQQMLDYIVALRGMTCDFECQNFTIQELPKKSDTEYYTVTELLGFIASAHGCNARFNYEGRLEFKSFAPAEAELNLSNVIDQTLDDSETFTVNGVLFYTGDDTQIYIDDVPGSEFDEDSEGIIKCTNPFASVEIAEYVWGQLGGLSYYGGSMDLRGAGIIECGDVITVGNLKFPSDTAEYPMCVTDISYSISRTEGFVETVSSKITETKDSVSNTSPQSSSGGVGKDVGNASEIFNSYSGSSANSITDSSYAHAEGAENGISNSNYAHAEGDFNHISSSACSHAEGESSHIMNSKWAHAGGYGCYIMSHADCGFAHGAGARVTGGVAAAFGSQTLAAGRNQLVAGKGNIEDSEDKYALIIGNGTEDPRGQTSFKASNALTLDWEGNLWVSGDINFSGGAVTNYKAGKGIEISEGKISINIASENVLGGVKAGDGVEIAADGTISVTGGAGGGSYTAGSGIEIAEDNTISVTPATDTALGGIILGEGLEYDPTTGKTNTVPNIQQAVIIQEKDVKYLLHEYTTVEYIAGNRICYAGAGNQIIVQGHIVYKSNGTAPNGVKIVYNIASANLSELPDIPIYTDMSFPELAIFNSGSVRISRIYLQLRTAGTNADTYIMKRVNEDGSETNIIALNNYNNFGLGFALLWNQIQPPGYTTGGVTYPYGCASCTYAYKAKTSTAQYQFYFQNADFFNIGFSSEAEYNAAVGLTYEPQTLTQVNETVTEV